MRARRFTIIAGVGGVILAAGMLLVALRYTRDGGDETPHPPGPPRVLRPLTRDADWPAFHRGGRLLGQGDVIGPPPMELRWSFKSDGGGFMQCSAAVVGRTAYVGDDAGVLWAIDLNDGTVRWRYKAETTLQCTPLVAGGRVFFGDTHGLFYALSADTGERLWTADCEKEIVSSPNLVGGNVVFCNSGGWGFCYTPEGTRVWATELANRVNGTAAVEGELLWIGACDGTLRVVDSSDGGEWMQIDTGEYLAAAPAVTPDGVILGGFDGKVFCYDPDTTRLKWTYDGIGRERLVYASAAWAEGVAVVGAQDHCVHGISGRTGERLWRFATGGDVDGSPAIASGRVYVGSRDGRFYVLDLHSGGELWSYRAEAAISFSPVVTAGLVIVGDEDGRLYCFESESPATTQPDVATRPADRPVSLP
ncbi:MAG: Outer membrane protein assembly factor BamB [Phycisphaerae bacterium]|nr:Outer membrane protein assembly factor BamB [Phycisphaerae bacterium]